MVAPRHIPVLSDSNNMPYLEKDEKILIVDDYPDFVLLLQDFLEEHKFSTVSAGSAARLRQMVAEENIALILLDIGLPDVSGLELLPELKKENPDLAVIMLTAVTDLETALDCIRRGADDYLTKPIKFSALLASLQTILEKRRLTINNRRYQQQIEQARFRNQLLHELTLQMNTAYLGMTDLDEILQAILVGITAEQGLRFNRAFLALFDEQGRELVGKLAIGPGDRDDGARIWNDIRTKDLRFEDLISRIREHSFIDNSEVNHIVQALHVSADQSKHILIRAARERRSIQVINGKSAWPVPPELLGLLQEESFVVRVTGLSKKEIKKLGGG
ncbi:MAG TPA: response regulator [Desulfobulbaceae bacterium]|nr:response regulator [Desulfobulbaceae bacterium]